MITTTNQKCTNYKLQIPSFLSRDDCINACVLNETLEQCNVLPDRINVPLNHSGRYASNSKEFECQKGIRKFCALKCPYPDCFRQIITPLVLGRRNYTYPWMWWQLYVPVEPTINLEQSIKLSLHEYFCLLLAVGAIWFG